MAHIEPVSAEQVGAIVGNTLDVVLNTAGIKTDPALRGKLDEVMRPLCADISAAYNLAAVAGQA